MVIQDVQIIILISDPPWTGCLNDCISLTDVDIQVDKGSTEVTASVGLYSDLPVETKCSKVSVSVVPVKQNDNKTNAKHKEPQSNPVKRSVRFNIFHFFNLLSSTNFVFNFAGGVKRN